MPSDQRDDLEQALLAHFDPEHLSVYSDYLQSIGDPRGELIALDLNEIDAPERRVQLAGEWLGAAAGDLLAIATIEHGFLSDLYLDGDDPRATPRLGALLAGPGAPYLRGLTLRGSPAWLQATVDQLIAHRHDWLQMLSIQATGRATAQATAQATGRGDPPAISDGSAQALAHALPRLEALEIWGRAVFGVLAHDGVASLRLTGSEAIGAVRLPALRMLDLAFAVENVPAVSQPALEALLATDRLPRLRRLDLSRNEPGCWAPHYLGGDGDPYPLLATCGVRHQLTHVRMPSLRRHDQAAWLAAALDDMRALRELSFARDYEDRSCALPPTAQPPAIWPWRPVDVIHETRTGPLASPRSGSLAARVVEGRIRGGPERRSDPRMLPTAPLVLWLEQQIEQLPHDIQMTWRQLFEALRALRGEVSVDLPKRTLLAALAVLDADGPAEDLAGWLALRDALAAAGEHTVVELIPVP